MEAGFTIRPFATSGPNFPASELFWRIYQLTTRIPLPPPIDVEAFIEEHKASALRGLTHDDNVELGLIMALLQDFV